MPHPTAPRRSPSCLNHMPSNDRHDTPECHARTRQDKSSAARLCYSTAVGWILVMGRSPPPLGDWFMKERCFLYSRVYSSKSAHNIFVCWGSLSSSSACVSLLSTICHTTMHSCTHPSTTCTHSIAAAAAAPSQHAASMHTNHKQQYISDLLS